MGVHGPPLDRRGKEPKVSLGLKGARPHGGLEGGPGAADPNLLPYFPGRQMELLPPPTLLNEQLEWSGRLQGGTGPRWWPGGY